MSIYDDGPWADAATDVEAERTAALLSTATVEAAPILAFMVASESSEDFATRLALMEDRIHSVASVVAGEGTPGYTSIIASLPEQFHARWQVAFEARQAAAQARNAPRAAARAAAREATKQAGAIEGIDCPGGFVKGDFKQGDKITCPECGQETYASPASGRFFEDDGTPYTGAYTYVHLLPGKTLDDRIRHDHGASKKVAVEKVADGWCCTDCLMLIANGDTSGYSGTDAEKAAWLAEVDRRSEGINWVPGDAEKEFSTRQCDVCGTMLAGARHEVIGLGTTASRTAADTKSLAKGDRVWWFGEGDKVLKGTYVGRATSGAAAGFTQSDPVEVEKDGGGTITIGAQDLVKGEPPRSTASRTAERGPKGFWCRYCGDYQSCRTSAEVKAMRAHMDKHEAAGHKPHEWDTPPEPGKGRMVPKNPAQRVSKQAAITPRDLASRTLDEVDNWYRQGVISQDLFEAYMHAWATSSAHAGYSNGAGWTDPTGFSQKVLDMAEEIKAAAAPGRSASSRRVLSMQHVAAEDNSWPPKDGEEKKAGTPEAPPAAPGAPADPNQAQPMQNAGGTAGAVQQGDVLLDAADGTAHSYVVNQMTDQGDTVLLDVTKDGGEQMQLQIPKIEQVQVLPSNNASPDQPVAPPEQAAPADPENPADPAAPVDPATDHGAEPTDPADPSQRPDNPFATDKKPDAEGDKNDPETEESQVKADDPEDKEEDKEEDDDDKKKPSFAKGSSRRLDLGNGLIAILPDTTATLRDHSRVASFGPPVTKRASMPTIPGLPSNVQGILSEQDWYDQWGAAMESLWGIAEAMAAKGERAPVEHNFGAGGAPSEEDIANDDSGEHYTAQGILEGLNRGDFTMADLEAATRALDAYCDELKAQGKDY